MERALPQSDATAISFHPGVYRAAKMDRCVKRALSAAAKVKRHYLQKECSNFSPVTLLKFGPQEAVAGDPYTRDPLLVLEDVRNGRVSVRAAKEDYGVAILDEKIDEVLTNALRQR